MTTLRVSKVVRRATTGFLRPKSWQCANAREGQSDWRSPGLDGKLPAPRHGASGHTGHHGDDVLFDYTKLGGQVALAQKGVKFDSAMPGFGVQLRDHEIMKILGVIKSTWPARQQEIQAARTHPAPKQDDN